MAFVKNRLLTNTAVTSALGRPPITIRRHFDAGLLGIVVYPIVKIIHTLYTIRLFLKRQCFKLKVIGIWHRWFCFDILHRCQGLIDVGMFFLFTIRQFFLHFSVVNTTIETTRYNHGCKHYNINIKIVSIFRSYSLIVMEIAMRFHLNIEINQNHAMTDAVMCCINYKYDIVAVILCTVH